MAGSKPIHRIMPQKTSFVRGKFSKEIGGQNWMYDTERTAIVKRPGTEKVCAALDEPAEYAKLSIQAVTSGTSPGFFGAAPRYGSYGLGVIRYNVWSGEHHGGQHLFSPAAASGGTASEYPRPKEELVAFGTQAYALRLVETPATVLGSGVFTITTSTQTGVKLSSGTAVTSFSEDTASGVAVGSDPTVLSSWYDQQNKGLYLSCGEMTLAKTYSFLYAPVFDYASPLLTSFTFPSNSTGLYNYDYWFPSLVPQNAYVDHTPMTSVQMGECLYIAGMASPLQCYDGNHFYAAGVPELSMVGQTLSAVAPTGAGITGTYQYRLAMRVYKPDGTYVEGPAVDLGSVSPAAQAVRIPVQYVQDPLNLVAGAVDGPTSTVNAAMRVGANEAKMVAMYPFLPVPMVASNTITNSFTTSAKHNARIGDYLIFGPSTATNAGSVTKISGLSTSGGTDTVGLADSVYCNECSAIAGLVLYRTVAGGTLFYERAVLNLNRSTYYDDEMTDVSLQARAEQDEPAYYQGLPPMRTSAVTAHQQRLVVAGDGSALRNRSSGGVAYTQSNDASKTPNYTEVAWSEPGTEHFAPDSIVSFQGQCSKITGLASYQDTLYVLTDVGVWTITGALIDATTFTVTRLAGGVGCASPASVVVDDTGVFYIGVDSSIVHIRGAQVDRYAGLFEASAPAALDVAGTFTFAAESTAVVNQIENKVYFFIPTGELRWSNADDVDAVPSVEKSGGVNRAEFDGDAESSIVIVFDKQANAFYRYTGILANGGAAVIDGHTVVASREANGVTRILRLNDLCTFDDGEAIPMKVVSGFEDADAPHLHKTFTRLTTYAGDATEEFSLNVKVERDWDENRYIQTFTQDFRDGEGYAQEAYATDAYGDGTVTERVTPLNNYKAKSLRVTFENNTTNDKPSISGWTLEYADTAKESRED